MVEPYYQDEYATIYHGDCREILPHVPEVDLVLTDPPYGIGYSRAYLHYPDEPWGDGVVGDDSHDAAAWAITQFMGTRLIIWGANNYPHLLPFGGVWLCWDKRVVDSADGVFGWPFELAWVNKRTGKARLYRIQHGGVINADGANMKRHHPTQKPVALFARILVDFPSDTVLGPFLGLGTTLVAAKYLNRRAIGIEIEERYCEIAANRCRQMVMELGI